ncbi:MAG: hypothetical protein WC457_04715 [Patescibacteria group bacterium]
MKKKILLIIIIALFLAFAREALAAGGFGLDTTAQQAGYETSGTTASLSGRVEIIISTVLGFVALGFFALTLYGGIIWLTARGKEEKVTQAKEILEAAVIGLVVISASYAIAKFVFAQLSTVGDSTTGTYCYWYDTTCTPINSEADSQACVADPSLGQIVSSCGG